MHRYTAPFVLALALAACGGQTEQPADSPLLNTVRPIRVNVARLHVIPGTEFAQDNGHVEQQFRIPPRVAIERWANNRFVAAGSKDMARMTIEEASVIESAVAESSSLLKSTFSKPKVQYDISAAVRFEICDERGQPKAFANAKVHRARTLDQDASREDKQAAFTEMTNSMLEDLDRELERSIRDRLQSVVMD